LKTQETKRQALTLTTAASVGLAAGQIEESPTPSFGSVVVDTDDDNSSRSSTGKSSNLIPTANLAYQVG